VTRGVSVFVRFRAPLQTAFCFIIKFNLFTKGNQKRVTQFTYTVKAVFSLLATLKKLTLLIA
jgi:hypothetical protein